MLGPKIHQKSRLGGILEASRAVLGGLGAILGRLRRVLVSSWAILGRLGGVLSRLGGVLGRPGGVMEAVLSKNILSAAWFGGCALGCVEC